MYTPADLLEEYAHLTLTIDSTEDTRKTACKGNYAKYAHLDPDALALRYEPDTDYLFVDASWLDQEIAEDLFKNTQYKGKTTVRFMKGTGHTVSTRTCHVFDLKATSALRAVDLKKQDNYRRKLMRELKGDVSAVAAEMEKYVDLDSRLTNALTKEELRNVKQEVKALLLRAQRLALGKPEKRILKKLGHLDTITDYIIAVKQQNRLSRFGVALKRENNIPHYTDITYLAGPDVAGVYKETMNRDGSNHKKRLYLAVNLLKPYARNYRRDSRYITSQTTYIKHQDADGNPVTTNIYCAVFDLMRTEAKEHTES